MIFFSLLIIPLVVAGVFFVGGGHKVTWKEFLLHLGAQALVAGVSAGVIFYQDVSDTEILNGRITRKAREEVSCSHSYSCNCYTSCSGSGSSQTCSTHCSTCYEHSYDVDWAVYTTLDNRFEIDRIDRQGLDQPARWTAVRIGEPYSETNTYVNYIKAAPDTLFRREVKDDRFTALPPYPQGIYDYYRLDRLVTVGVNPADRKAWNLALSEANATLGTQAVPARRSNAVVVLVKGQPKEWGEALERKWIGGKKNDIVVVAGVDAALKPEWVKVMAWTDVNMFKVALRDRILALPTMADPASTTTAIVQTAAAHYVRKPMKDFEYLAALITPTPTQYGVALFFGLLIAVVLGFVFVKYDVFDEERRTPPWLNRKPTYRRS